MDFPTRSFSFLVSDLPATRLGKLVLAGEVFDAGTAVPVSLRVMHDYVLSLAVSGRATYRHADGHEQPIMTGAVTVVHPGQLHRYGTAAGDRWTELFAVFSGPIFDTFAAAGLLANDGPRRPQPSPSTALLRTVLKAAPATRKAAEHQLLALADWLVDAAPADDTSAPSPAIARAVELLTADFATPVDMRTVAAETGLAYDTFRRQFAAEVGQPPRAFRNAQRLQAAANLLRITDMTVQAIARTLGYSDEFHLSRRFHTHFGSSPSVYRAR